MQFKVPQDVQREDTIIGPITLKQLIIIGIGGAITYAIYISLAATYFIEIWLAPVLISGGLTAAFAFLKINNLPFHLFLMNFLEYKILPRKRIWIQGAGIPFISSFDTQKSNKEHKTIVSKENAKGTKDFNELSKILDTKESNKESPEITKFEKKDQLEKLIKQNY